MSQIDSRALLDEILIRLEAYEAMPDEEKDNEAPILLRSALGMVSAACGPDLIGRAYGRRDQPDASEGEEATEEENRSVALEALSERLHICARLFASVEDFGSRGTVREAAQEAYLIANGDKPRLFASIGGKQGQRAAAYALAMCKCQAVDCR